MTGILLRGRLLLLPAAFLFLGSSQLCAQSIGNPPIDYKAVPKLEQLKDRAAAPDFSLPGPDGRKLALRDYRGKLVFLNFWATWCEFCREEMPAMERLYQEFKGKGFVVLAVNVKDKRSDALAFVRKFKLTYPIMLDPEGEIGLLYGAFGMPTTYLIDENGMALARLWGPADWHSAGARNLIKTLLERRPRPT